MKAEIKDDRICCFPIRDLQRCTGPTSGNPGWTSPVLRLILVVAGCADWKLSLVFHIEFMCRSIQSESLGGKKIGHLAWVFQLMDRKDQ